MIISFFSRDEPGVKGTINTNEDAPTATGVGEEILESWMTTFKDKDPKSAMRSLETFYSSWSNQGSYSAIEPGGVTPDSLNVVVTASGAMVLQRVNPDDLEVRENEAWRAAEDDDDLGGKIIPVEDTIIGPWDAGKITDVGQLDKYKQES